jgi:DNA repair protein RadC
VLETSMLAIMFVTMVVGGVSLLFVIFKELRSIRRELAESVEREVSSELARTFLARFRELQEIESRSQQSIDEVEILLADLKAKAEAADRMIQEVEQIRERVDQVLDATSPENMTETVSTKLYEQMRSSVGPISP